MSKTLQWMLGLAALVLVLAFAGSMILPYFFPTAAGYGMMSQGMMGRGMMGGWGRMGGFGPGMLTWPLLVVGLLVAAAVWFGRGQRTTQPPAAAAPTAVPQCPACGQSLQLDWKACPHCGERL